MSTPLGQPADAERFRTMTEFSIGFDGRQYDVFGYRYDRLADAAGYARLMRTRNPGNARARPLWEMPRDLLPDGPEEPELRLMAAHGITFAAGNYHYRGFRYSRLVDAVGYAQMLADRGDRPQ